MTTDIAGMELTHSAATTLFRMAQEALTNVARHAQASVVNVTMCVDEGELVLVIEDNGIGIAPEALHGSHSLSLQGMQERLKEVGGAVEIEGQAGHGTVVAIRVPV